MIQTTGLKPLSREDWLDAVENVAAPFIRRMMEKRSPGHCMRVVDIDVDLMVKLCRRLRDICPEVQTFVLAAQEVPSDISVTSTKLVELRNPLADGTQRPPLLVFLPPAIKAAAEDSFGIATFESISLKPVFQELKASLLAEIEPRFRSSIDVIFRELPTARTSIHAQIRYLLLAKRNVVDSASLGASLFELGLIPDFELFDHPDFVQVRTRRNLEALDVLRTSGLSERRRVLSLELLDAIFCRSLADLIMSIPAVQDWTRAIALDSNLWFLGFHKWSFPDSHRGEVSPTISNMVLDIPAFDTPTQNRAHAELYGQQVFIVGKHKKFSVEFSVDPIPQHVPGLEKFVANVFRHAENEGTGISRQKKIGEGKVSRTKITFSSLGKLQWEDGWYHVEISALHENGVNLISKESESHISDPFYVLTSSTSDQHDDAVTKAKSRPFPTLGHALLKQRFQHLLSQESSEFSDAVSVLWSETESLYEVRSGQWGSAQVPMSRRLQLWERQILTSPEGPFSYEISQGTLSPLLMDLPECDGFPEFIRARKAWFTAIQSQSGDRTLSSVHPGALLDVGERYIAAYQLALESAYQSAALGNWIPVGKLLEIDQLHWKPSSDADAVICLSPTHPSIVRWWLDWWKLGQSWCGSSKGATPQAIQAARDSIVDEIRPAGVPPFISTSGTQRLYFANLDYTWSAYILPNATQRLSLRDDLERSLACTCNISHILSTDSGYVAQRVRRYLLQHPYIGTLKIRAIQPGKGNFLVSILDSLEKDPLFRDMRFDFQLYVDDPQSEQEGDDLHSLLHAGILSSDELGGDHLRPKFRIAIRSMESLMSENDQFHLTFLFDAFPASQIKATPTNPSTPWLKGLLTQASINYHEDLETAYWLHQYTGSHPIDRSYAKALAALSVGSTDETLELAVILNLTTELRRSIHRIHELSDWVFCLDRNLGIEYFDHGGSKKDRQDYLIDHSPDLMKVDGRSLVVTSRSTTELQSLVAPCLALYPFHDDPRLAELLLLQLRCLSGRLALKLISNPTQRAEAMGLALARLFLEQNGDLLDSVLVPLDAHQDLFHSVGKQSSELGKDISLQRTDFALFKVDATNKVVHCKLIEVKCYQKIDPQTWLNLQTQITGQLHRSRDVLVSHFGTPSRADQEFKAWQLAQTLDYYTRRSLRYDAMPSETGNTLRDSLNLLSKGFRFNVELEAMVFDFSAASDLHHNDDGIMWHRIGFATMQQQIRERLELATTTQSLAASFAQVLKLRDRTCTVDSVDVDQAFVHDPIVLKTAVKISDVPPALKTVEVLIPKIVAPTVVEPIVEKAIGQNQSNTVVNPDLVPTSTTCDIFLGVGSKSDQFGLLGESISGRVGLDLNHTHTISLFGVQGGGKSYTLGSILEMACLSLPGINQLPAPLASVVFHYSPTMDYKPEFTSMVHPNDSESQLKVLHERDGALPAALKDIVLIVPPGTIEDRRREFPGLEVRPLVFNPSELKSSHWSYLLGVVGNDSLYIRQVKAILKQMRKGLNVQLLRTAIQSSSMADHLRDLALSRLQLAEEYIRDDTDTLGSLIVPGRLVIVDMRDEHIERDEALSLFVVLLQLFSEVNNPEKHFNKLFVFDEAHKYMGNADLVGGLIEIVREMRHKGSSILVASQDPPSLLVALLELSSQMILHKFTSPQWLKHLQKANSSLDTLTSEKLASLGKGEAYVWSREASESVFTKQAIKLQCRPRATRHGGDTKKAIG